MTDTQDRTPSKMAGQYVAIFAKNCPNVSLTEEDRAELWRLFHLALQSNAGRG